MRPNADIRQLRQDIALRQKPAPHPWPSVSLGAPALDEALPGAGLATGALHEFLPAPQNNLAAPGGFGFGVLSQILRIHTGNVLLAAPDYYLSRAGAIHPLGFMAFGCDPDRFIEARAPNGKNVLWALEEGLESGSLAAAVGILPDNDRVYDFTCSRRLAIRAAESGVTALLVRSGTDAEMSTAALTRWSLAAAPSAPQHWGAVLPGGGPPQWRAELTKSKGGAPGGWRIEWDNETLSFRLAAALADRTPVRPRRSARKEWAVAS